MINHCELFIYFDNGYSSSFHEVNIFTKFDLYKINVKFLSI
jgi:hypothetical protein